MQFRIGDRVCLSVDGLSQGLGDSGMIGTVEKLMSSDKGVYVLWDDYKSPAQYGACYLSLADKDETIEGIKQRINQTMKVIKDVPKPFQLEAFKIVLKKLLDE